MARYKKSFPKFKQGWWDNTKPIEDKTYKSGIAPGMTPEQTAVYLAAHPYPPPGPQKPNVQINIEWGPKFNYTPPLYYPDGETLRISKI